ncbi:MAG: MaLMM01 [Firmicutes bacterium]|nr:MaLMM01 [Bacillota bacterium]
MADTTTNLSIPLLKGTTMVSKTAINDSLEAVDENALPNSHAESKAHFDMWQPNMEYKKQAAVKTPTCPSWGFYSCSVPGTSGTTEPIGYGEGDVIVDNGVTWILKPFGGASSIKHGDLTGRNVADQHTIAAITGLQMALDAKESLANKGQAGGYPNLNADGYVPLAQLPPNIKEMRVVSNIAARDAITGADLYESLQVHVIDATGDPTVKSGWAEYIYDATNTTWVKRAEKESMDVILDYANIQNIPIAVSNLSVVNGKLFYNGSPVYDDVRTVVFVGGSTEIVYPFSGTIQKIAVICSEPQSSDLSFNVEVQTKANYQAQADVWNLVGGSALTLTANTALQEYTNLGSTNLTISAGDVLRASTAGDDTGVVFHVTIKNN